MIVRRSSSLVSKALLVATLFMVIVSAASAQIVIDGFVDDWRLVPPLMGTTDPAMHDSPMGRIASVKAAADPEYLHVEVTFQQPRLFVDDWSGDLAKGYWDAFEYLEIDSDADGVWDYRTRLGRGKRPAVNNLMVLGAKNGELRGPVLAAEGDEGWEAGGPRAYFSKDRRSVEMRLPRKPLKIDKPRVIGLRVRLRYRDSVQGSDRWVEEVAPAAGKWLRFELRKPLGRDEPPEFTVGRVMLPPGPADAAEEPREKPLPSVEDAIDVAPAVALPEFAPQAQPTPAITPEPTPTPTPEPTPISTPEPTPTPVPEPTPLPEPELTPEPTPTPTPAPTPTPVPSGPPGNLPGEPIAIDGKLDDWASPPFVHPLTARARVRAVNDISTIEQVALNESQEYLYVRLDFEKERDLPGEAKPDNRDSGAYLRFDWNFDGQSDMELQFFEVRPGDAIIGSRVVAADGVRLMSSVDTAGTLLAALSGNKRTIECRLPKRELNLNYGTWLRLQLIARYRDDEGQWRQLTFPSQTGWYACTLKP